MDTARPMIRPAAAADLEAIAAIYDDEVVTGYGTFDVEPIGTAPFATKLDGEDPVLVAVDDDDRVLGFAYAAAYRPRAAYARTRETSVYLHRDARGRGTGRVLYADLLDRLDAAGIHRVIAVIAQPNEASVALHRSLGFSEVGVLSEVGRKMGRWVDVALYERQARDGVR